MSLIKFVHTDWIPEHIDKTHPYNAALKPFGHRSTNLKRPQHQRTSQTRSARSGHRSCSGRKKPKKHLLRSAIRSMLSVTPFPSRVIAMGRRTFAVSLFPKTKKTLWKYLKWQSTYPCNKEALPATPRPFLVWLFPLGPGVASNRSSSATAQRPVHLSLGRTGSFLNEVHGCGPPAWWTSTMIFLSFDLQELSPAYAKQVSAYEGSGYNQVTTKLTKHITNDAQHTPAASFLGQLDAMLASIQKMQTNEGICPSYQHSHFSVNLGHQPTGLILSPLNHCKSLSSK